MVGVKVEGGRGWQTRSCRLFGVSSLVNKRLLNNHKMTFPPPLRQL